MIKMERDAMVRSIKERFDSGNIVLIPPEEEAEMDSDCRHRIAIISSNLHYAQIQAATGDYDSFERGLRHAVGSARAVINGPEFKNDKLAFLDRVIPEAKTACASAIKRWPQYAEIEFLKHMSNLRTMREQVAQQQHTVLEPVSMR